MPTEAAIDYAQRTRSQLVGTESAANGILRVRYTHDAMIDLLLARPEIRQREIAAHFSVSEGWISRVFNSDAFLARLAERKAEVVDPLIVHSMEEKFAGIADQSIEIIAEKLAAGRSPDLAMRALELSSKALGYGARKEATNVQNNFVVALPPKVESAVDWAKQYSPGVASTGVVDLPSSTPPPDKNPGSDLMKLFEGGAPAAA